MNPFSPRPLTPEDQKNLEARWIDRQTAAAQGIGRVHHLEGIGLVGTHGRYNLDGLAIPYVWPGEARVREWTLRLDVPIPNNGRQLRYLWPHQKRPLLYIPNGVTPEELNDVTLPVIFVEGAFKAIALDRLARINGKRRFLAVAFAGVWLFHGTIGRTLDADGRYNTQTGVISDMGEPAAR